MKESNNRVLVISNMYPSSQKPYSGVFVKNQYEALRYQGGVMVAIHALPRSFTSGLGSVLKYVLFFIKFLPYIFKKYDVLHVHFFGYHAFLAALYKLLHPKAKLVITVHGSDTENIGGVIFKPIIKQVDTVIAVGRDQAKYIRDKHKELSVIFLPAGIDENKFYKVPNTLTKYDFIFVGSFYEIKGVDILIEAIKNLEAHNYSYCFVGSGKYNSDISALKANHQVVIKNNQTQDEIRDLLNASKFLVLPSRGDSFGLVVSEAMYCGVPVIVSNIGGVKDQVTNATDGFILEKNTPKILADTMHEAMQLDTAQYLKMSQMAATANKQYSMTNTIQKLVRIYLS